MDELSPGQWEAIDALLFEDITILAIKTYRGSTGAGLPKAIEAIQDRREFLRKEQPERFKSDAEYRAEAFRHLQSISEPILVIEGSWDGDSDGWHIDLSAITDEPSHEHPKYRTHRLYYVKGRENQVERAIAFGTELANAVGAEFYLTDTETLYVNYEKRWWDEHG